MKKIFALGFFDGVHLGHQALLKQCLQMAQEQDAAPVAFTFDRHPQSLFLDTPPKLINTLEDRQELLRHYGIGSVFVYPVVPEVMEMPWQSFLEELLRHEAAGFVCGSDFRFGNRGEGNAQRLTEFCKARELSCAIVEQQLLDGIRISSTHIRQLLEAGDMETAIRFLGHPHILSGAVVSGRRIGRTIGVPTANLQLPAEVVPLRQGVYACKAKVEDQTFLAVTNVGNRPTVGGRHVTVEPWLLDFSGDLYGRQLTLEFHKFLRPEIQFPSLEALRTEICNNAQQTREFFEKS